MATVFNVYKTDVWHSQGSRDLIGIGINFFHALALVRSQMRREGYDTIETETLVQLSTIFQTQGYDGPGEFVIEERELNKLF